MTVTYYVKHFGTRSPARARALAAKHGARVIVREAVNNQGRVRRELLDAATGATLDRQVAR